MLAETSKYSCFSFVYHNMSQTANRNHSFELIYKNPPPHPQALTFYIPLHVNILLLELFAN